MNPQDIIIGCLKENLITAKKDGTVYSNFKNKNLGCLSTRGYYVCTLHFKGVRKQVKIHQIIWIYFNGKIPVNMIIDHINRIKNDNHIENLRLVTQKMNSNNRRSYSGENNPSAKLFFEEVENIRYLHKNHGLSYSDLSDAFSISKSLIAAIIRREIWV